MKKRVRAFVLVSFSLVLCCSTGCNKLRARDQLNKGVQSYKNARFEEAISHFQQAVHLDPSLLNGRLYLATAYAQQYIPGAGPEDNNLMAEQAIDQFKQVLDMHPGREQEIGSLKGIASLYFNMHKLDVAKQYHKKVGQLDPDDPETYYSIGVIDWTQAYRPDMEERVRLGLRPDDAVRDSRVCAALHARNSEVIQDGLDNLNKALQLRPDYDDAMAYVNLLYRQKADIECDTTASAADLKIAQEWVDKTMVAKKARAERRPSGSAITLDQPSN